MSTPTTINAIAMPVLSDAPTIEGYHTAFNAIDTRLVPRFATVSAMNTAITAPSAGQMAYAADSDELYRYSGITNSWLSAAPRTKIKATTQIVQNNTYVADDALFISLESNSAYEVHMSVPMQSNTTPQYKWKFTIPVGATGYYRAGQWGIGAGSFINSQMKEWSTTGDSAVATNGTLQYMMFDGQIYTTTAGTLQYLWAQFVTNVSNTSTFFNATITTTKIR